MSEPRQRTTGPLQLLATGTAAYFVIGAVGRAVQLASVPVLLRFLTAGEYGVQAIALLNEQLLMIVVGYAFTNALGRYYVEVERERGEGGTIAGSALAAVLVLGTVGLAAWEALAPVIARATLDGSSTSLTVTRLIGVSALANLVITVVTSVWQLDLRLRPYAVAVVGQAVLAAGIAVVSVAGFAAGPTGVVGAWTAASLAVAVGAGWKLAAEGSLQVRREAVVLLARYGGPLVPAALLMLVLTANDRYLLAELDGLQAVGVYATVLAIGNGLNTVLVSPFKRAFVPLMWRLRDDPGEVDFHRRVFTLYWLAQATLLVPLAVFGDTILAAVSGGGDDTFRRSGVALAVVYGGLALLNSFDLLSAGYFFAGRTVLYPVTVAASTATALAWNVGLIPVWGIWAAAASNPVSYGVFAVLSYLFGRRYFVVPYEWRRVATILAWAAVVVSLAAAARVVLGPAGDGLAFVAVAAYPLLAARFGGLGSAEWSAALTRVGQLRPGATSDAAGGVEEHSRAPSDGQR